MECPSCHSEMPDNSKFCEACGAALPERCGSCGATSRAGARFCSNCGKVLTTGSAAATITTANAAPSSPPVYPPASAERRQLTVMFCDLVDSTALSARLDPEDMREIIGAYHRCCAEQITKAGGFVAKYMGDGVLAYFGYPEANEDDAEMAVRSALTLAETVPTVETAQGVALQVRIGIATGLVVVGDLVGEGDAQERGIVGDPPNLAARLQSFAEAGQVVISQNTRRLSGGLFTYNDLGLLKLKGFSGPIRAWRVLRASAIESRFDARHEAGLTPMVGREEELEVLLRRWRQVQLGEGRAVVIVGEPGIGKSRILREFQDRLPHSSYVRLHYFCSPHYQNSALYPTITALERAAEFGRDDAPDKKLAKLRALLAQSAAGPDEVALIADLLSIPTEERQKLAELSPQKRKEKTLQALQAQTERLAAWQPLLVVYEDAQWIDPSSFELLSMSVERISKHHILLLVTARPEFVPHWHDYAHVTTLSVTRLDRREMSALVERIAGGKTLPPEILEQILARTDGVPLFVEELTKTVLESGLLREQAETYALAAPLPPLAIPVTLHDALMARLGRLSPVREVAQIGSVIGREFSHELISAVATMPTARLEDALAQLIQSELVFRRGQPPETVYTFKHSLVRDAVYSTALRSQRQQLHARIAATLESQFPEVASAQPELLAHHYAGAGLVQQSIAYWLSAGQQSVARSAMSEAVAQLRRGLSLVQDIADAKSRQQHELDLQLTLGFPLMATQGYTAPVVGEAYARARELCKQLDRSDQMVPVLLAQWTYHIIRGELEIARARSEELVELAKARDDPALKLMGFRNKGMTCFYLGEIEEAHANIDRALDIFDPALRTVYAALAPEDVHAVSLAYSSFILFWLGSFDRARACRDDALAESRQLSHAYTRAFTLALTWAGDWATGSIDELSARAEELMTISAEHDLPFFLAEGKMLYGSCLVECGSEAEGISLFTEGLALYRAMGCALVTPFFYTLLANAYNRMGRREDALAQLAEAARMIEVTHESYTEAEVHRLRGELVKSSNPDAAEACFRRALDIAERQKARLLELRASISLARLWRDQGRDIEAREFLAPIYGWFTEGFDTPLLQETKALLQELG